MFVNEKINYGEGFKILMEKHDSLNNEQHTAKAMKNAFENSKTVAEEYIEFNIRTKDQISDTGERWIVYPVISNSSVTGLVAGILNKEETTVEFRNLKPGNEYYDQLIPLFREQFQKSLISARQLNRNGKCGHINQPPCEIDVIIITPPNSGGGGGIGIGIGDGGGEGTPKPCSKYENCIHNDPGGGGGGVPLPYEDPKTPCEKVKAQTTNLDFKNKITDLAGKTGLKKETGYSESKSGVFTELQPSASTENSDGMTIHVTADTKGYIHTHLNNYETGNFNDEGTPIVNQPIRMFSPADVNTLMTMAGFITDGNYSELYGAMVSSYGNYTIKFTGTASNIKTGFDTEEWRKSYLKYKADHDLWSFEKLFLNFLKDKMNVQGVELYKIKDNGTIQKKTLKSNNNVQSSDCP